MSYNHWIEVLPWVCVCMCFLWLIVFCVYFVLCVFEHGKYEIHKYLIPLMIKHPSIKILIKLHLCIVTKIQRFWDFNFLIKICHISWLAPYFCVQYIYIHSWQRISTTPTPTPDLYSQYCLSSPCLQFFPTSSISPPCYSI